MSIQALSWVLDHSPTRGSDRLVLVAIANHAGELVEDAWEAYPGVATLRREAGLERERTVVDALTRLAAAGHIERVVNGAPDERIRRDRRPNLYRILLTNGVSCGVTRCAWCGVSRDAARGVAIRRDGVSRSDATGCRDATGKPSVEPSSEPPGKPSSAIVPAPLLPLPLAAASFDAFWSVYPRKTDKGAARRAWATAIKKASPERIIDGAARYRDDPNRVEQYTKHPASWLNAEAWDNGPLPGRRTAVDEANDEMRARHAMIRRVAAQAFGEGG